jgi:hypothetical protein
VRHNVSPRFVSAMSSPAIPTKTTLGHEELRHRVHRLSQRHRTVLLLVDGVRPLSEVLGMAQKAGASTQHFEELLRLGLVELPAPPEPAPEPAVDEPAGLLVSVPVPMAAPPPAEPAEPAEPLTLTAPLARALAAAAAAPAPVAPPAAAPVPAPPATARPPLRAAKAPPPAPAKSRSAKPAAARAARKPASPPEMPPLTLTVPFELPVLTVVEDEPSSEATESETALHDQVLELLRTVVRREPPPFTSRVPTRLARCSTPKELGELVLDIERYLVQSRRDRNLREVMPLLREARELLGLGNTRVVSASGEDYS